MISPTELRGSISTYIEDHKKAIAECLFLTAIVGISLGAGTLLERLELPPVRPDVSCKGTANTAQSASYLLDVSTMASLGIPAQDQAESISQACETQNEVEEYYNNSQSLH
jgi:hypothetical protein